MNFRNLNDSDEDYPNQLIYPDQYSDYEDNNYQLDDTLDQPQYAKTYQQTMGNLGASQSQDGSVGNSQVSKNRITFPNELQDGSAHKKPGAFLPKDPNMPLLPGQMIEQSSQGVGLQNEKQDQTEEVDENFGCWYSLMRCMGWSISKEQRTIYLNGSTKPSSFGTNKLNNQKYSIITFLPKLLYNEFKFFFNMFFLLIAMSQFVPFLKVGLMVTYIAPLAFVLVVTMLKEMFDDYQRMLRDKDLNLSKVEKLAYDQKTGSFKLKQIYSKDIRVGQILRLKHNSRVPADMLLIYTSEKSGSVFLRTDQLDGETDWKLRKAVATTQQMEPQDLLSCGAHVVCLPPDEALYDFKGYFQGAAAQGEELPARVPLSLENTLWQNTVVASQGFCFGLVMYNGKETRSNMSGKIPRSKVGSLDKEINFLAKILFVVMCFISMIIICMDGFYGSWYFKYFRCVLLLCSIIPISMRLNLDFAKVYYSYQINNDPNIKNAVVRNSTIPEELGRIQFLLSDKTGTLTKNDMIFKKLNLEFYSFTEENLDDVQQLLKKGLKKKNDQYLSKRDLKMVGDNDTSDEGGSIMDADQFTNKPSTDKTVSTNNLSIHHQESEKETNTQQTTITKIQKNRKRGRRREQHQIVMDLFLALILCHNVTPVYTELEEHDENEEEDSINPQEQQPQASSKSESGSEGQGYFKKEFQAASPDEIALVKFSEQLGMILEDRGELHIKIKDSNSVEHEYEILENFPFSSDTKRMGIIVQHKYTQQITFYVKGAEVVMEKKVRPDQRVSLVESCEQLAQDGLRTLVISQKNISEEEYQIFKHEYNRAKANLYGREEAMQESIENLEREMEFLAVTGVEDKLQDNVLETIEKFRDAGIQVWMLTGDKIETAKCIAIATGMNRKTESVHEIRGDMGDRLTEFNLKESIEAYEKKNKQKTMLMVDGTCLTIILADKNNDLKEKFFRVAGQAKSVCICRCSPTQKALVARYIKFYTKKNIACVGDGGNDVAMIQEADVGLGIVGREGMQASLAADFSLIQFSHLKELVLWHGRMSYQRSAKLSQFVIHRGMIISFIQAIFTMIFFSVTIPIYNGYLILGYSTIYTSLPVFSLVFDEDVDRETCLRFPILYQSLQAGRSLNFKTFLIWIWKSIFQAAVIMFLSVILFPDSFLMIMSITFTTLIFTEFLNVCQEVTVIKSRTIISILISILTYATSIYFFNTLFQIQAFEATFFLKVAIITAASWSPLWIIKKGHDFFDPDAVMKIKKSSR